MNHSLIQYLPRSVQQRLRRWHAPRVAARFTDADWPAASIVRALVKLGDTVVDVGANIGYISARLADYVGPTGRVYSIEAVPDTFDLLQHTVRKLDLKQVTPLNVCASSAPGEVEMEIPRYTQGVENLYESHVIQDNKEKRPTTIDRRIRVPAQPLDALIPVSSGPIVFIKIDVEGHELEVLEGVRRILARSTPALYIEVSGDPDQRDSKAAHLFGELCSFGYEALWWDGQRLNVRIQGVHSVDYFFLQSQHKHIPLIREALRDDV